MGEAFAELVRGGPLLLAVGAAALAGLVSFLSPCVLPLIPGYLSYVTGLAGADLDATLRQPARRVRAPAYAGAPAAADPEPVGEPDGRVRRGRVLAGTLLFVAGFTAVYALTAIALTEVGTALAVNRRWFEIGVGVVIVVLGAAFLGWVPGLRREVRLRRLPAAGLAGAPVFGAVFALSWAPCTGPTIGAVLGLAATTGQTDRALVLAVAYCLGLGLPFIAYGVAFRRVSALVPAIRRHSRWITRIGGGLLILVGLAMVTGGWQRFTIWLLTTFGTGSTGI